jgi:hypothetical protein
MARFSRLSALLWVLAIAASAQGQPETPDEPRYLRAVRQELQRVRAEATCEAEGRARGRCLFDHAAAEGDGRWPVRVVVSEQANTVTLVVTELGTIPPDDPSADERLRRLAELNWALNGLHLEWDPRTGAVRLSAVQRTDTNFDRRAFRVLLRLLLFQAERLAPQLG